MNYQRETVEGIQNEIVPLVQQHYSEIAPHQDIALSPDLELFQKADHSGMLRLFTARNAEGRLVGYAVFFLRRHHHFQTCLQATLDLLYLEPASRGPGLSFLRFLESELQREGAEVIHFHVTTRFDYSALLRRLGYQPLETTYTKRVKA